MTSQTSGPGREPAPSCAECGARAEPGKSFCDSCGAIISWAGSQEPAPSAPAASRAPAASQAPAAPSAPAAAPSCAECGTRAEPGQAFCDSCGAVLGWAGGPDRPAAAPVTAGAAAARDSAADRGPDRGPDRKADNDPRWDAFTVSSAGTGSARTAHDPPATAASPAVGHPSGDDTHRRDGEPGSTTGRPESGIVPEQAGHAQPAAPSGGAGVRLSRPADPAAPAPGSAPSEPDTTPPGLWNTAAAAASASAATPAAAAPSSTPAAPAAPAPGTPNGPYGDDTDTEPRVAFGHGVPHPSGSDSGSGSDSAERARSLLIPVNDPEPRAPVAPAVAPVLPGRPVAGRPQVRAPGPQSGPDDGPPCPWCSTPNRPDRHFCARCAMPMEGGPRPPERQTWWRRMVNWRNMENPWAGDRPRLRRGFGRIMNWVVGAAVIGLVIALIVNIGDGVDATRDHFAKRAPVGPDSVKASRSYAGHGAQSAFDGLSNTWWGPGVSQAGEGEWVEARFDNPTRLLDVVITSGVSAKVEHLQESALPHRIEAQITTADGKKSSRIINLDRSAGGQPRKFRVGAVVAVRFILRSAYATDSKKQVSIAEIELFGRSNGSRA
ncbi:hypothetical protein QF026_004620 [Streptomyces aurantiacus]|uniref:NADase-type glycan-binding domain-containing protein n=1 Tax=Streptomyces aurantiacus TaxID=47760 RepID=UPI00278FF487|nr:hypothetical protein [Streptomyces aurantiacus]